MAEVTERDIAEGVVPIGEPLPDTDVLVRDSELRSGAHHRAKAVRSIKRPCFLMLTKHSPS